jgi:hypothetical protein
VGINWQAALIDVEDWPAAIDAADRAFALDPTDPWAHVPECLGGETTIT